MAVAADVPGVYDVVINGQGYIFANTVDQSLPFRVQRASYGYSPTFVDRSNVSNQYGDNAQDFFPTVRQRDWSLGEQQKFFRTGQDGRYWMGSNVDVATPGQVRLSPPLTSATFAAAVSAAARQTGAQNVVTASATNLYQIEVDGTITDKGAHGLGAKPFRYGICTDGTSNYLSATAGGSVGIRAWNGGAFSTFSAAAVDALAFLNNTLYGVGASVLIKLDTAGVSTTLFSWKTATGGAAANQVPILHPFGGKLLILFPYAQEASELWIYDGTGAYRLEVLPENFIANDIEVLYGVVYVAGSFMKPGSATIDALKPGIIFYDGNIGKLWEANDFNTSTIAVANEIIGPHPALGVSNGRLIFTDETTGNLMAYNPATGGVSSIGTFTPNAGDSAWIASTGRMLLHTRNQTTGYYYPSATYPSSGYVISSLIDFESSLSKQFRGVKVEWDAASDGNGGSVDIAYQVDSLTGAWTTLQTGAVSGTEYTFTNISGRSIAFKVTINKGTSTSGPTLKALSVRGAPIVTRFRRGEYLIDCAGRDGKSPVRLRNDQDSSLDGQALANNLKTAVTSTTPFSITDRFGTFTGLCEPEKCEFVELRPEEYIVRLFVREV